MSTAVMFLPRTTATPEQIASANRYLALCDERLARRCYALIVARLNKRLGGDPYGWDVPTARVLGYGQLLDVANLIAAHVNALASPADQPAA